MENTSGGSNNNNNNNINGWNGTLGSKTEYNVRSSDCARTGSQRPSSAATSKVDNPGGKSSSDSVQNGCTSNRKPTDPTYRNEEAKAAALTRLPSGSADEDSDDDYCVYTYKGDGKDQHRMADLPSSFYQFDSSDNQSGEKGSLPGSNGNVFPKAVDGITLPNGRPRNCVSNGIAAAQNNVFSPDMDFLEMDFDPNMYADVEEGNEDQTDNEVPGFVPDRPKPDLHNFGILSDSPVDSVVQEVPTPCCSKTMPAVSAVVDNIAALHFPTAKISGDSSASSKSKFSESIPYRSADAGDRLRFSANASGISRANTAITPELASTVNSNTCPGGDCLGSVRLVKSNTLPELKSKNGVTVSSQGVGIGHVDISSSLSSSAPRLKDQDYSWSYKTFIDTSVGYVSEEREVKRVMIWDVSVAKEIAHSQIGKSACGTTAVLNVLTALQFEATPDFVNTCVGTRLRAENDDLPQYLFSRSSAGATHEDLIKGIELASVDTISGRFFQLCPNFSVTSFNTWLLNWISKGAIPVVTRNLQVGQYCSSAEIPDSWHHQMVFGVSRQELYLSNPIEIVGSVDLLPQLTSQSILLVRRHDVISRKRPNTDLRQLVRHTDTRWNDMNVLGQVANILLEELPSANEGNPRGMKSSHIKIPAVYKAGVTLFMRRESKYFKPLMTSEEFSPG